VIKIDDWMTVASIGSPYQAPETLGICLRGMVYGHSRFENGDAVRTSVVVKVEGRKVFTRSGSVYRLGRINPGFRKFLKKEKPDWDWRNPIVTK